MFYRLNVVSYKIQACSLIETVKLILKFIWKFKHPRTGKTILNNPNFKTTVMKTVSYWHQERHTDQWYRTENSGETPPLPWKSMASWFLTRVPSPLHGNRVSSTHGAETTLIPESLCWSTPLVFISTKDPMYKTWYIEKLAKNGSKTQT